MTEHHLASAFTQAQREIQIEQLTYAGCQSKRRRETGLAIGLEHQLGALERHLVEATVHAEDHSGSLPEGLTRAGTARQRTQQIPRPSFVLELRRVRS